VTDKVKVEDRGAVRILTLNRPDQRNCVDGETALGLGRAIQQFAADERARVLVITGAGDVSFCAGADLKNPASLLEHELVDVAGPMGFARLDPGKPTLAAINGFCFAGGGELAAWCDIRIAAENAEFGCLSRRWGVPYTDGGTQRFARIMGTGNALYLLLTGVRIGVERAFQLGLVQEVLSGLHRDLDEGLLLEAELVRPSLLSEELIAGLGRFAEGARDPSPRPPR
jgi:enoyl-CoA hydratase